MVTDELVQVAVPRSRLEEVYKLLGQPSVDPATLRRTSMQGAESGEADPEAAAADDEPDEWSIEQLAVISTDPRPSFEAVRALLDVLADQPGTYVPMTKICGNTGYEWTRLRGALSGFGKTEVMKCNGVPPWWTQQIASADSSTARESAYMLSEVAADRWKRLRRG